jgi:hypothetical protein
MTHRAAHAKAVRCEKCQRRYWRIWKDETGFGKCSREGCGGDVKVGPSLAQERRNQRAEADLRRYGFFSPS